MNPELIRLIESNEIQIHGDVEYFAELVAAAEREKLNNGRCIACGNHITEGGGQVVPTLEGSNGQA